LQLQAQSGKGSRVEALLELGRARVGAGDLSAAETPLLEALHLAQNNSGAKSLDSGHALWALGMLRQQQGRLGEAKDLYVQSLSILDAAHAPETDVSHVLSDLAMVYTWQQQWVLAKQTHERALEIDRRLLGDDHPRVAMRLSNLAIVAQNMGDLQQAESLYREAIRRNEQTYGDRHPESAAAKGLYGLLLQREGRLPEAEALLRAALDTKLSLYGPDHYTVGYSRVSLAILLHDKGDLAGAESEFRQALAVYDKSLPANHQYRASLLMNFARLLVDRDKSAEALAKSTDSINIWAATSLPSSPLMAQAHATHAYALEHLHRFAEAATELDAAVPVLVQARGLDDPAVRRAQLWLKAARPDSLQTVSTAAAVH